MALGLSDTDWSSGKTKRKKLLASSSKEPILKGAGGNRHVGYLAKAGLDRKIIIIQFRILSKN